MAMALYANVATLIACGSVTPQTSPSLESSAQTRLWTVRAGTDPGVVEMEGHAAPGLEVDLVDAHGWIGRAQVTNEPASDCDHCRPRVVARLSTAGSDLDETTAIAISPPSGQSARVTWHPYVLSLAPAAEAVAWASVDREGDGQVDAELVVWCGERVPSGCDAHVCAEACWGTRDFGTTQPSDAECLRFVPDVDDCLP